MTPAKTQDARTTASKNAIAGAFIQLLMEMPYEQINVRLIIEYAGVARSTFYEHFRSKDDLFVYALHDIYAALFRNVIGTADADSNSQVLSALWEKRALLRRLGEPTAFVMIVKGFDNFIHERISRLSLTVPARALSRQLASALLHPINAWMRGEFRAGQDDISRLLTNMSCVLKAHRQ